VRIVGVKSDWFTRFNASKVCVNVIPLFVIVVARLEGTPVRAPPEVIASRLFLEGHLVLNVLGKVPKVEVNTVLWFVSADVLFLCLPLVIEWKVDRKSPFSDAPSIWQ
jgi:hypothetical protein